MMKTKRRKKIVKNLFISTCIISFMLCFSVFLGLEHLLNNKVSQHSIKIILALRFKQACLVFCVGAMLALAGAIMQAMLDNPLADPYTLGTSQAAAVGTLIAIHYNLTNIYFTSLPFLFAVFSIICILFLTKIIKPEKLLLFGLSSSSLLSSCIVIALVTLPPIKTKSFYFWLIGDITTIEFNVLPILVLFVGSLIAIYNARKITVYSLFGYKKAYSLGIKINNLRLTCLFIAGLFTATSVSYAGSVGFVGLMIPHIIRAFGVFAYEKIIPLSIIVGGIFLMLCDLISRVAIAPNQLPIGAITAVIGSPTFIYLLLRKNHEH